MKAKKIIEQTVKVIAPFVFRIIGTGMEFMERLR